MDLEQLKLEIEKAYNIRITSIRFEDLTDNCIGKRLTQNGDNNILVNQVIANEQEIRRTIWHEARHIDTDRVERFRYLYDTLGPLARGKNPVTEADKLEYFYLLTEIDARRAELLEANMDDRILNSVPVELVAQYIHMPQYERILRASVLTAEKPDSPTRELFENLMHQHFQIIQSALVSLLSIGTII